MAPITAPDCRPAARASGCLGRPRFALLNHFLGHDFDLAAVDGDGLQIQRQLRAAGQPACLLIRNELGDYIRSARNHRVAVNYDWFVDAGAERLAGGIPLGIHIVDEADDERGAGGYFDPLFWWRSGRVERCPA